jgi:enterochelin esterase-like enzyme
MVDSNLMHRGSNTSVVVIVLLASLGVGCQRAGSAEMTQTAFKPTRVIAPTSSTWEATLAIPPTKVEKPATTTPSPTTVCRETCGRLVETTYQGYVLRKPIAVQVYLPPCYPSGQDRYPVLYLLHGFPYDETHWIELGVDQSADEGIRSGKWSPFIIVMPRQPDPLFTSTDGGPGSYEEEMVDGLIAFIDQTYATEASQDSRLLAGVSRGGVWALEITLRHPELFDAVAALSPALHVNYARPPYDPMLLAKENAALPKRIFLSAGDRESAFRAKTEAFSQLVEGSGVELQLVISPGGHDAETWTAVMGEMLDFLLAGW